MTTLVPVVLASASLTRWRVYVRKWTIAQWAFLGALIVASMIVFGNRETNEFKFFYLIFPPSIAFADKDDMKGASVAIFLSDALMRRNRNHILDFLTATIANCFLFSSRQFKDRMLANRFVQRDKSKWLISGGVLDVIALPSWV